MKGLNKGRRKHRFWVFNYKTRNNAHITFRAMSVHGEESRPELCETKAWGKSRTKSYPMELW